MIGLQEQYLDALTSKIDALEIALREFDADPQGASASLRRIAHALRGSGASYGFPVISEIAGAVEEATEKNVRLQARKLVDTLRDQIRLQAGKGWTILVVEDNPIDLEIIRQALAVTGRRILSVGSTAEALCKLAEESIHLVVSDLMLPDSDGRNLLLKIRESKRTASVPIVVVSSLCNEQIRAECRALGAYQFIAKPVDPRLLSASVSTALLSSGAAAERWSHDSLTGLHNRAGFLVAFEGVRSLTDRMKQKLSVAILDLDRFKTINDRYGHAAGDEALSASAKCVLERLRKSDLLARWGGEEFVALFPETPEAGATYALTDALETLKAQVFTSPDGEPFHVTFSAGVCEIEAGESLADALARADRSLYSAKAAGRQRVFCSTSDAKIPPRRVLLVEDDEAVAKLVRWRLSSEHLSVACCSSAEEALREAAAAPVELGIFDVNMPGMDGFELLRRFRELPQTEGVPVVMLTGRGAEKDILRGFDLGADDYIVKPFSPTELEARVHRLLKRAGGPSRATD